MVLVFRVTLLGFCWCKTKKSITIKSVFKKKKKKKLIDKFSVVFIIFWDLLMFYQILLSPKVKQSAIICNKHGIYKLPHKFPNDLRLRTLGN